jgi:hypothetical protein
MRAIQAWIMGLWLTMVPLRLTVLCLRLTMIYHLSPVQAIAPPLTRFSHRIASSTKAG